MARDLGDVVSVRYESRDPDGALTDTTTVALTVTAPSGNISTPSVVHPSLGIYDSALTLTESGTWRYRWTATGPITDVQSGQIECGDPPPALYSDLPTLRSALNIADASRDVLLHRALSAAARSIDRHCGRRFYVDSAVSQRVYRLQGRVAASCDGQGVIVDDIAATIGLIVEVGDGASWIAVADYTTEPDNAVARGMPITLLRRTAGHWMSNVRTRVRVTARWGWPAVPDEIAQAALIQAARLYRRKDSPEGVTGSAEWGLVRVSRLDPDVQALTAPYVLPGVA